jgi:alpha-L-fucosidase
VNGQAIYETHPWKRAEGASLEGIPIRFTQKDSSIFAILLGDVKTSSITLKSLTVAPGSKIYLVGSEKPLVWSQQDADIKIEVATPLSGKYAYALRFEGPVS